MNILTNFDLLFIAISSVEKCRSIKDHYAIEQVIDQKLFTNGSRPVCIAQRLEIINRLDQEEKDRPFTHFEPPEPIYTGLPIKLIKKRKLNLLDIETQQVSLCIRFFINFTFLILPFLFLFYLSYFYLFFSTLSFILNFYLFFWILSFFSELYHFFLNFTFFWFFITKFRC